MYISLDVGATKIAAATVSGPKVGPKIKMATQAKAANQTIINNLKQAVGSIYNRHIQGIGVGIAGAVDQANGVLISSPNFSKKFKNIRLAKLLQAEFKKPVKLENDANCFTLGEARFGAGRGYRHVIGLTLGTGVGGGIVIDQQIYNGAQGLAGELGHLVVYGQPIIKKYTPLPYLEHYTSGPAMEKIYRALGGVAIDSYAIQEQYKKRDPHAIKTINIMAQALGLGLVSLLHIFNPDLIVLGGGLAEVKIITAPAIKFAKAKVIFPQLAKTRIVISNLGIDAPLLGAASLFKK